MRVIIWKRRRYTRRHRINISHTSWSYSFVLFDASAWQKGKKRSKPRKNIVISVSSPIWTCWKNPPLRSICFGSFTSIVIARIKLQITACHAELRALESFPAVNFIPSHRRGLRRSRCFAKAIENSTKLGKYRNVAIGAGNEWLGLNEEGM